MKRDAILSLARRLGVGAAVLGGTVFATLAVTRAQAATAQADRADAPREEGRPNAGRAEPAASERPPPSAAPLAKLCDVPLGMALWGTCDPVPRSRDAWDEALASGKAGVLELGSDPRMRLRVDGRDYGIAVGGDARVTRLPVSPGPHVLDFISDEYVFAVRREVNVGPGQTARIVLALRDRLPKAVAPGEGWYAGQSDGRPIFTNVPQKPPVVATSPIAKRP